MEQNVKVSNCANITWARGVQQVPISLGEHLAIRVLVPDFFTTLPAVLAAGEVEVLPREGESHNRATSAGGNGLAGQQKGIPMNCAEEIHDVYKRPVARNSRQLRTARAGRWMQVRGLQYGFIFWQLSLGLPLQSPDKDHCLPSQRSHRHMQICNAGLRHLHYA